jgi:serine phosphatase RsbU (regulator of sigma subunit)/anti-sigma regulatory factor (Ser/Thr protein kinase)
MTAALDSFDLGADADVVPQARRFARGLLREQRDDVVADAELVVTELVTNALLYATGSDITLRVGNDGELVRIEVEDGGRALPLAALDRADSMTGRGLKLVAALASRWGVEAAEVDRKVVWAELGAPRDPAGLDDLGPGPEMDAAALLEAWSDELDIEERFTVRLGSVPTELLLDAKAHIDNVVREFTLASASASSDGGAALPAHLASLITTVVRGFAEARLAIKQQALLAARRGDDETELVLTLPVSAADAGEQYLAALDEADGYARAARLLTLETPPVHQVFRRWYVQSLVDKLRAQAADAPMPLTPSFPMRLAEEVSALAGLRAASRRTTGLYDVGSALAGLTTPAEVAEAVVRTGIEVLGARAGGLAGYLDGRLKVLAAVGFPASYLGDLEKADVTSSTLPGPVVFHSGEPIWIESAEERDRLFPALATVEAGIVSTCLVPLVAGRRLGVLRFNFAVPRLFDESERRFVLALADQAALALQRSELFVAERTAREGAEQLAHTLNTLVTISSALAGAGTVEEILQIVASGLRDHIGAGVTCAHLSGSNAGAANSLSSIQPADTAVLDAGEIAFLDRMSQEFGGARALDTSHEAAGGLASVIARYADRPNVVIAPIDIGGRHLGVLAAIFTGADVAPLIQVVSALAASAAQALERSIASARAARAADRLRFLAEASVALFETLDFDATLKMVARLVVPGLADWCVIQIVEGTEAQGISTIAVSHADPAKVVLADEMLRRYPADPSKAGGAHQVMRTGISELYLDASEESVNARAANPEHARMLRDLGLASVLVVPLTGRSGTFGAITLVRADANRPYDDSDREFAEDLARRAAVAVGTVAAFESQQGRLAAVMRIAEAAQAAILAPPPARIGPVSLAARYVSATAEALIGGDLYEVVARPGAVRLLIGDVRGKGVEAVRNAAIVLGEFRGAAADLDSLEAVAGQIDRRLVSYLGSEDFVTGLIAEIADDGRFTVLCCGHPPALLFSGGVVRAIEAVPSLPLGLGTSPVAVTGQLVPGDRLLLYTDGLIEARNRERRFVEVSDIVGSLGVGDLDAGLDAVLAALRTATGAELADDLALLVAEYVGLE